MPIHDLEDEDRIIKDGEVVRVPVTLMDHKTVHDIIANANRPAAPASRYGQYTDAQKAARAAMYDAQDQALSEAWQQPMPLAPQTAADGPAAEYVAAASAAAMDDVYKRHDASIRDAWKGGAA
jgi:hypothetical protein